MLYRCLIVSSFLAAAACSDSSPRTAEVPRTSDGKPDLQGIWQAQNPAADDLAALATIPYQPWALEQKRANFASRAAGDPLGRCYLPGVPRIMYLDFPFQIFQASAHIAMTFEWSQVHRLIYMSGAPQLYPGIPSWMGHSRGRWDGDVLVVEVTDHNDKTWLDAAGAFHSEELRVTERYRMLDADTIEYEATLEDPKVFSAPWSIHVTLHRRDDLDRIHEFQCQAVAEEASGAFEPDLRTWYPAEPPPDNAPFDADAGDDLPVLTTPADIPRLADGTPDLNGYYQHDHGGANYGLETKPQVFLLPASRGVVIDPPTGRLPYQEWARAERLDRELPHRGYDDPTAHCFVAGIPRSHYIPSPSHIVQTEDFVVFLFERMAWRQIALDGRAHAPDDTRFWMGDSVGRWDGDTLVVEARNFNGKAWLNEAGDVITHAQTVVETFTPVSAGQVIYRATVSDPIAYTRPWTIEIPLDRQPDELLEVACHEDNNDLQHLKDVRDEYRAQQKEEE
jgi:hypothetical protein